MSDIKVSVNDQSLFITNAPLIASGGINEDRIIFTFDLTWNGFGKIAIFYNDRDKQIYKVAIDENGVAIVPAQVTFDPGKIYFGVVGVKENVTLTSQILFYEILEGAIYTGQVDPPQDIYEQILAIAGNIEALYYALEADQEAFEASVNDTLANTPYLYYEEDEDFELPVNTINDEETGLESTWSSTKINAELETKVIIDDSQKSQTSAWSSAKIVDMIYPVGAIFMSVVNTNPSTYLGGTWVRWGLGRVPVSVNESGTEFDTVEKTGGSISETLTQSQIPSHTHTVPAHGHTATAESAGAHAHHIQRWQAAVETSGGNRYLAQGAIDEESYTSTNGNHTHTITVNNHAAFDTQGTGGNAAHNNLQPYITCYMFKRTA